MGEKGGKEDLGPSIARPATEGTCHVIVRDVLSFFGFGKHYNLICIDVLIIRAVPQLTPFDI